MKMKVLHILCCLLVTGSLFGQQLPIFSQQTYNKFAFNPAYAGNKNQVEAMFTHRNHMLSFPGAPTSQLVTVTAPWQKKYMGFGLRVVNDNIGATSHFSMNAAANYGVRIGPGKLTMGLELGFDQYAVDWSSVAIHDAGDDIIPTTDASITKPNASFGLFYTTEYWYAGYSVQNLIASRLQFQGTETENAAHQSAHHYINIGGVKKFNETLQIEPFLFIKSTSGNGAQMDLGSYIVFKESYGAGVAYRTGDAVVLTAKVNLLSKFYLGYSYEARINSLSPYAGSSHELMIGYFHKLLEPARKKVIHPRYYF